MAGRLDGITILQVIPEMETGGAERTVVEVAEAIIGAGGRALVVSEGGPMVGELEALGATHIGMAVASKNPVTVWTNAGRLAKLIESEGVDIVHARSRAPAWSAYRAARRTGTAFVTTYHGIYRAKSALKRAYNSVMARGDVVIANSRYTAAAVLAEHTPRPLDDPSRLVVIHRGADLARFTGDLVSSDRLMALAAQWGGQGALKVLLPGRLTEWKGQKTLIEAARILRSTRQELNLRIVLAGSDQGRTAYRQELASLIRESDLEKVVLMPGNCADMPAGLKWADLVVSASTRPEAFGRVAIEAQAMARPVIATDHGGARETVADGKTGWLVPPGDAEAMAARIADFAGMPDGDRQAMGQAARANAEAHFSVSRMTAATLDVYERVLAARKS